MFDKSNVEALAKALLEGFKELMRVTIFAAAPVILAGINTTTGDIAINWNLVKAMAIVALVTGVLKMMDRTKHAYTKEVEGPDGRPHGILPF